MNKVYSILTVFIVSSINCANAKTVEGIPDDIFDQSKPYGINLSVADQYLGKEREAGTSNSPITTLFLFRTLKDKKDEMDSSFLKKNKIERKDIIAMNAMDTTIDAQKKKVMILFGLSENQVNALPGMSQNTASRSSKILKEIAKESPILAKIAVEGLAFFSDLQTKPTSERSGYNRIRGRSFERSPHLTYRRLEIPAH